VSQISIVFETLWQWNSPAPGADAMTVKRPAPGAGELMKSVSGIWCRQMPPSALSKNYRRSSAWSSLPSPAFNATAPSRIHLHPTQQLPAERHRH